MGVMEILGLILGGGATGVVGSLINRVGRYFEDAQRNAHELALQRLNIQARGRELESEEAIVESESAAQIRAGSYEHDASYGAVLPLAASILRFVRPALTLLLLLMVAGIWLQLDASQTALQTQIVSTVLYLAVVSITWWFGSRDKEKTTKLPWL